VYNEGPALTTRHDVPLTNDTVNLRNLNLTL
jgi:hypothetical protein